MYSSANLLSPTSPTARRTEWAPPAPAYARGPRFSRSSSDTSLISSDHASHPTISEKYVLPMDPVVFNFPEEDDHLHNPDPRRDGSGHIFTARGLANLGCLVVLVLSILALFAGYPIMAYFMRQKPSYDDDNVTLNLGGRNATGYLPIIPGLRQLIDPDTPDEVREKVDYVNGKTWQLVFSDEFNTEGRSFYPGDDPYWEAVDLHYWVTGNKEWYDPRAVTTRNGSLEIQLSQTPNHNLNYTGGMVASWNKLCFTGGLIEARVMLPGYNNVRGLWPSIWTMGNLGRAGYGASTEGMWPYSYDACDIGTVKGQVVNGQPVEATEGNSPYDDGVLSFLPGQRLSRCTCPGESHPGPKHDNGEYVGRSAPEIDMFEAQIGGSHLGKVGSVSQSAQWAPFNYKYNPNGTYDIADATMSSNNSYTGGVYQQATSVVTGTDQTAYEYDGYQYATYAFQYQPGFGDAYISWIADGKLAWTLNQAIMGPDNVVGISDRPISQEPMYLIMNLGISESFGGVQYDQLTFPSTMRVDYVRVYQDPHAVNIGCDPPGFPTTAYIEQYSEAYNNPNLTTWVDDYGQTMPKNKYLGQC